MPPRRPAPAGPRAAAVAALWLGLPWLAACGGSSGGGPDPLAPPAWSSAERLAGPALNLASTPPRPAVAIDAGGTAFAVWSEARGTEQGTLRQRIFTRRHEPGVGWQALDVIDPAEPATADPPTDAPPPADPGAPAPTPGGADRLRAREPEVEVDGVGNAVALWVQSAGDSTELWSSRWTPGRSWSAPEAVSAAASSAPPARRSSGGPPTARFLDGRVGGAAVAAFVRRVSDEPLRTQVEAARFEPLTGWGSPEVVVPTGPEVLTAARAALDPEGAATVLFRRGLVGGGVVLEASHRRAGDTAWGTAAPVSEPGDGIGAHRIEAGAAGRARAVWVRSEAEGGSALRSSRLGPDGTWAAPASVDPPAGDGEAVDPGGPRPLDFLPALSTAPGGAAALAWLRFDGGVVQLLVSLLETDPGGPWPAAAVVAGEGPGAGLDDPAVGVLDDGTTIAVWSQRTRGLTEIRSRVHRPGSEWSEPARVHLTDHEVEDLALSVHPDGPAALVWSERLGEVELAEPLSEIEVWGAVLGPGPGLSQDR